MRKTTQDQIGRADLAIVPQIPNQSTFTLYGFEGMLEAGELATRNHEPKLLKFSVPKSDFERRNSLRLKFDTSPASLSSIRTLGLDKVSEESLLERLKAKPGESPDFLRLREDLHRIYSLGDFERADFAISSNRKKMGTQSHSLRRHLGRRDQG